MKPSQRSGTYDGKCDDYGLNSLFSSLVLKLFRHPTSIVSNST